MNNLFDVKAEDVLSEVFFSELLAGDKSERYYSFRLVGWNSPKSAGSGNNNYQVIESIALNDYPEISLFSGQLCNLHISMPVFQRALIKLLSYNKMGHILNLLKDSSRVLVVELRFCRSYRGMNIKYLKVFEILSCNEEKLIAQVPK